MHIWFNHLPVRMSGSCRDDVNVVDDSEHTRRSRARSGRNAFLQIVFSAAGGATRILDSAANQVSRAHIHRLAVVAG